MADLSITAGSVVAATSAKRRVGVAGATITAGQIVYLDATDGRYKLADADAAGVSAITRVSMALSGASAGQPITVMESGRVTINAVLTAGTAYYLSPTAGGVAPLGDIGSGDNVILLGLARSTTVLEFAPIISGVTL